MPTPWSAETIDAALAVQLALVQVWESCGEQVGGWKVGMTTSDPRTAGDNRKQFEPGYRPFGFVLRNRILASGATVPRQAIQVCHIEPELCLVIGEALGGSDVDPHRARKAVRAVAAAFEVNEVRHVGRHTPLPIRVAGGLNNWGMVVGTPIEPPDWDIRSTSVEVRCNDGAPETITMPEAAFDDPYVSLSRLCRRLDRFDRGLREGDHVLTGAFSHHGVSAGETWRATFSDIGDVAITFTHDP